jgi:hypothetical protein
MVVCGGQGGLGDKDEDKGVVNWKLLPAGVGTHEWDSRRGARPRTSGAPSLSEEKNCIWARSRGSPHLDRHEPGGIGIVSSNQSRRVGSRIRRPPGLGRLRASAGSFTVRLKTDAQAGARCFGKPLQGAG